MKINIRLNAEVNVPLWMLGAPRPAPKVILSLEEPGPVTVNFTELTENEQKHVLLGIQKGTLESSVDFTKLLDEHTKQFAPPPKMEEAIIPDMPALNKPQEEAQQTVVQKYEKEEAKRQDRCRSIIKMNMRSIKSILPNIADLKTLRLLHSLEKARPKPRAAVLALLDTKIRKVHSSIEDKLALSAAKPPMVDRYTPHDKINYQVEDSDYEEISIEGVVGPLQ